MIIQGGLNTEHPKSEPVQNMNVLEIGIGMVWFWNGRDYRYSYVIELTIQKQNQYIRIQDGIQISPNLLKTEPFINPTASNHLKSKQVQYLSSRTLFHISRTSKVN